MFQRIFIEQHLQNHPRAQEILSHFPKVRVSPIENIEQVFGKVRKPYLQKRDNFQLFIAEKRGKLVKPAPDAYGLKGDPHYYFIHAYNCIYECDYCYLQGHFNSPDIVLFINHDAICQDIRTTTLSHADTNQSVWFHAGEFSDSLALSHFTNELQYYFELFKQLPQAKLELRTKSANIRSLMEQTPLENVITSFTLAPESQAKQHDHKAAPLKARLQAMAKLYQAGHPLAVHFDPIIYTDTLIEDYSSLLTEMEKHFPLSALEYISLGVVRFTKKVFNAMQINYPGSPLLGADFITSFDGKRRYSRPMRLWMLQKIKSLCIEKAMPEKLIYLCMEQN